MDATEKVYGIVHHHEIPEKNDYLFRISLKAVIFNEEGHVLIVKEHGHDWWDIPGGGINHGESIKEAIARELYEEVSLQGDFEYKTILAEDPRHSINHKLYQMRVTFLVKPENMTFEAGDDCAEIAFVDPANYENSEVITERLIFEYCQLAKRNQGS